MFINKIAKIQIELGYFLIKVFLGLLRLLVDILSVLCKTSHVFASKFAFEFKSLCRELAALFKGLKSLHKEVKLMQKSVNKKNPQLGYKRFNEKLLRRERSRKWADYLTSLCTKSLVGFREFFNWFRKNILRVSKALVSFILSAVLFPFRLIRSFFHFLYEAHVFVFMAGAVFALTFIMLPYELYVLARTLPSTDLLVEKGNRRSTKILDRNGNLLYEIYEDRNYEPVELRQIPDHVVQATLAIEDDRFYEHAGFRLDSIARALHAIVFEGDLQGASTITQQLVKNVLLTPERTLSRKAKELILSVMVENKYSKDQILELYLNNISYGGTAWGIEAAAQKFFDKHVWELDVAEASMLAGLPSAPSVYSPLGNETDKAKERQRKVLDRMVAQGYLNSSEAEEAYKKELEYAPQKHFIRAPHFVVYVRHLLEQKYGSRYVTFGGLTIKTSLDLELQEEVQQIVREGVADNAYLNLQNGAAIVLDVKTGGILAYVGSVDFFKEGWGAYDVLTANRQPGSSIKPVTYALALSQNFTPATLINDSPTSFPLQGQKPYKPVNYDGRYHGNVTVRQALANSYNIPAVKVVQSVSPQGMVRLAKDMGLTSWNVEDAYGLAVTLGGKEVKMIEHANVYATFARGGQYLPTEPFLSIKDSNGKEIHRANFMKTEVLDPGVAFLITNILSDNNARAPTFGYRSPLYIPGRQVAVKTGTTDNKRDNWTMGYTPSYVVGVWVGNNDNSQMNQYLASGLTGAAPIWNEIMTTVLEDSPAEEFIVPDNVFLKVDKDCGRSEYFLKGSRVPERLCPKPKDEDKDDDKENEEPKDD